MKISKDFLLKKIADTYVVVPLGKKSSEFKAIISLNESGAFLFGLLQEGADKNELIEKMLAEYDVNDKTATTDVNEFIESVRNAGILEEDNK